MSKKYDHIREKAIFFRREQKLSLDEITERLQIPKGTIYSWIKDIPVTIKRGKSVLSRAAILAAAKAKTEKYRKIRQEAYDSSKKEAKEILKNQLTRDFIVMYMAEGFKKSKNSISICNSDPKIMDMSFKGIKILGHKNKLYFTLQIHEDNDEEELQKFWAKRYNIDYALVRVTRKSNSNKMSKRNWRSIYGVFTIGCNDTDLRCRIEGLIDYIKEDWEKTSSDLTNSIEHKTYNHIQI